jgi:hypothetical protein
VKMKYKMKSYIDVRGYVCANLGYSWSYQT